MTTLVCPIPSLEGIKDDVWVRWERGHPPGVREEILARFAPLVRHIVGRMKVSLVPEADRDDLESAGALGLLRALERFDPSRNVKFDTFAYRWVQGSLLDHLRRLDPLSRGGRRRVEEYRSTVMTLRERLGRDPSDEELREALNLNEDAMRSLRWEVSHSGSVPLEGLETEDTCSSPLTTLTDTSEPEVLSLLEKRETLSSLSHAIQDLPQKERLVVSLYYNDELTFREIGEVLEVSESRVCQIHTRAVSRVRAALLSL